MCNSFCKREKNASLAIYILVLTFCSLLVCLFPGQALAKTTTEIFQTCIPSVVTIYQVNNKENIAQGSGFFYGAEGNIVTNYHVVEDAAAIVVKLADGNIFPIVSVIAQDPDKDLALLSTKIPKKPKGLTISEKIPVQGTNVIVIGSPLGLEKTLSDGVVSAIRTVENLNLVQITAPISHGSSGSPVLNLNGEVIGIATLTFKYGQNLNFAVSGKDIANFIATKPFKESKPATHETAGQSNVAWKTATAGDTILKKGAMKPSSIYRMSNKIKSSIPGSMGINFAFRIDQCDLSFYFETDYHTYYAAPYGLFNATFSLYGNVVDPNDKIGIRVSKADNSIEWFVDNSIWNKMAPGSVIWTRKVKPQDGVEFEILEGPPVPDISSGITEVVYDGFYNNLIHLTLRRIAFLPQEQVSETKFHFNPESGGGVTTLSMKGLVLNVGNVDNLGIKYDWVKTDI